MKGINDIELKIIKDFITKINNDKINESNAASECKKLKQKVNNDKLKHELVKHLEKSLFGEDIESIEPEEKYEESIAERVKTRKQNTQKTFAPSTPPKKDYSEETADYLKYMEEQEKGQKRFSDDYDNKIAFYVNKIALSNDDDKRIVSPDKIRSYPYGYAF